MIAVVVIDHGPQTTDPVFWVSGGLSSGVYCLVLVPAVYSRPFCRMTSAYHRPLSFMIRAWVS